MSDINVGSNEIYVTDNADDMIPVLTSVFDMTHEQLLAEICKEAI